MTIRAAMALSGLAPALVVPRVALAVVLACGSSFAFNAAASSARPGPLHAFAWAPLVEEAAKTGFGMAVGAPLVPVHVGFGMTEAVYDALAHRRTGAAAALLSLLGHGIFGLATSGLLASGWHPLLAMVGAAAVHALWNLIVVALAPTHW